MNYLPLLVFVVLIAVLLWAAGRARRKQAVAQTEMQSRIGVGTDVMTTSGLHGTVVSVGDDGTVQLAIAPGVEVRWELAALRDSAALPSRYTRPGPRGTGYAGGPPTGPSLEKSPDPDEPGRGPDPH